MRQGGQARHGSGGHQDHHLPRIPEIGHLVEWVGEYCEFHRVSPSPRTRFACVLLGVLGQLDPGKDVAFVVEFADYDLIGGDYDLDHGLAAADFVDRGDAGKLSVKFCKRERVSTVAYQTIWAINARTGEMSRRADLMRLTPAGSCSSLGVAVFLGVVRT
jgi:hypothetical protein